MGLVHNHRICNTHKWTRYGTDGFLGSIDGPGVATNGINHLFVDNGLDPDG